MCTFFLKANIYDFNKAYYNALNVFKMKEEVAFGMGVKRLAEMRRYFEQ